MGPAHPERRLLAALAALLIAACAGQAVTTPAVQTAPAASSTSDTGSSAMPTRAPPESPLELPSTVAASPSSSGPSSPDAVASSSASAAASPAQSFEGPVYDNPVFASDFPDPHVLLVGDSYYAYSTNSANQNLPVISSTDLATWRRERDGMPALPRWALPNFGNTWAPGVIQIGDTFIDYFVARDTQSDRQCIGLAVADNPIGPFSDDSQEPFICQVELGGSIDPYPFRDVNGKLYLYWKNDGNCCAKPVDLWVQPLSDDGLRLTGDPKELIERDQPWEIPLVENPAMVENDGSYYLFYSANRWDSHEYAVGYALCETVTGPCEKPLDEPIYMYTMDVFGPGGESVFAQADGDLVMAYHAWSPPNVGYPQGVRSLRIDPLNFVDGSPVITGPTVDPQPLP